jgi:hypothetical protein
MIATPRVPLPARASCFRSSDQAARRASVPAGRSRHQCRTFQQPRTGGRRPGCRRSSSREWPLGQVVVLVAPFGVLMKSARRESDLRSAQACLAHYGQSDRPCEGVRQAGRHRRPYTRAVAVDVAPTGRRAGDRRGLGLAGDRAQSGRHGGPLFRSLFVTCPRRLPRGSGTEYMARRTVSRSNCLTRSSIHLVALVSHKSPLRVMYAS